MPACRSSPRKSRLPLFGSLLIVSTAVTALFTVMLTDLPLQMLGRSGLVRTAIMQTAAAPG